MRRRLPTTLCLLLLALSFSWTQAQLLPSQLHVALLGDSNTWLGGDNCDKPRGWNKWLRDFLAPASLRSYARSGATWTNTPATVRDLNDVTGSIGDQNVIYNQVNRLFAAADSGVQAPPHVIIVSCGTNDVWFLSKRPAALDLSVEQAFASPEPIIRTKQPAEVLTLAESVRFNLELLQERFPDARIVLLTPLQSTAIDYRLIAQAGDMIEQAGKRMNAEIIRLDKDCGISSRTERQKKTYTYDGTHTNAAGAERVGRLVCERLRLMFDK